MLKGFAVVVVVSLSAMTVEALAQQKHRPAYGGTDGTVVEFWDHGFYIKYFGADGVQSFDCRKVGDLTDKLHYGQCVGGERFIFTLDPTKPEMMKIGDVTYKQCGRDWEHCQDIVGPGAE